MAGPNEIIHQTMRLRIMSTLHPLGRGELIEFTRLKSILKATDGNLGAHLNTLEAAGYIKVVKDFEGKKPRTRVGMTSAGRLAFDSHITYLRTIIEGSSEG